MTFVQLECGHITFYSKFFEDGFFCIHCSLFNPKILYYEIAERIREWKDIT